MTAAQDGRPGGTGGEQAPTVSTAPASAPRWWSSVPSHLGRARTSTVILAVLFLALGTLYLNVRPDAPGTATAVTGPTRPAPTAPAAPPSRRSAAPTTSSAPAPTTTAPSTTSGSPRFTSTPSESAPTTTEPGTGAPESTVPTTLPTAGTTAAPTT